MDYRESLPAGRAALGWLTAAAAAVLLAACGGGDVGTETVADASSEPTADARVTAMGTPYGSTAPTVPATIEAENFDRGGQRVGYYDLTAGNSGGQYRTGESVDIIASADAAGGGYVVNNFQTGEWLAYTINVPAAGNYEIELRAASMFAASAFHVEVDGVNVSGRVNVPNTGSWSAFQWVGKKTVALAAGTRVLRIVADEQYFNLNSIRIAAAPASTPYSGTPIVVPATIEAENFDHGGEGIAYHDNGAGNAGGQYRTGENVDIVASTDAAGGGYVVNNFETGEWLAYTINVATAGNYDLELRAASALTGSAFHLEIDGQDVTGRIGVPNTGSWNGFQWVGKKGVPLAAGRRVLKVVSDQQYFNLNSIRIAAASAPAATPPPTGAKLLFKSGFEGGTALGSLLMYGNGAWQDITGTDSETGFAWPPKIWGGTNSRLQLIAGDGVSVTSSTLGSYIYNQLQTVTGRTGAATRALYSTVQQSVGGALVNWNSTQNDFIIFPGTNQGDLYVSYWLKFQPDLLEKMTANSWAGRVVSDWKTGTGTGGGGDYRILFSVFGDGANKRLYWNLKGDNVANGGLPQQVFWNLNNTTVPVPVGRWFRVEMFVHRSGGADGRVWIAVDGQRLFDRFGPNMGVYGLPWNRVMAFMNYSSGQVLPAYQWVDDFELWDGFPSHASAH
jgi:hypothetical protein